MNASSIALTMAPRRTRSPKRFHSDASRWSRGGGPTPGLPVRRLRRCRGSRPSTSPARWAGPAHPRCRGASPGSPRDAALIQAVHVIGEAEHRTAVRGVEEQQRFWGSMSMPACHASGLVGWPRRRWCGPRSAGDSGVGTLRPTGDFMRGLHAWLSALAVPSTCTGCSFRC